MDEVNSRRCDQPTAPAPDRRHEHAPVLARDAAQLHSRRGTLRYVPEALTYSYSAKTVGPENRSAINQNLCAEILAAVTRPLSLW
jgi:hypothetical protein